jgi:hypothetical protein
MINLSMLKGLLKTICPKGIAIQLTDYSGHIFDNGQMTITIFSDNKQIYSTKISDIEKEVNG